MIRQPPVKGRGKDLLEVVCLVAFVVHINELCCIPTFLLENSLPEVVGFGILR